MKNLKKDSSEAERVYDVTGYVLRAACVCVRDDGGEEAEVLLVSSPRRDGSWIVPGGKRHAEEEPGKKMPLVNSFYFEIYFFARITV